MIISLLALEITPSNRTKAKRGHHPKLCAGKFVYPTDFRSWLNVVNYSVKYLHYLPAVWSISLALLGCVHLGETSNDFRKQPKCFFANQVV